MYIVYKYDFKWLRWYVAIKWKYFWNRYLDYKVIKEFEKHVFISISYVN